MNKNIEISLRLKEFIEKNFSSLAEISRLLNKHRSFFTPYISGKSIPGGELLKELAEIGLDVNWLLLGDTNNILKLSDKKEEYNPQQTETDLLKEISFKFDRLLLQHEDIILRLKALEENQIKK